MTGRQQGGAMNHVWGLFSHPDREMHVIKSENETVSHHYTHHVLLMAAVPVICAFIGTTQIGWNFGDGTVVQLSWFTGLYLAILFYGLMLAGVAVMGRVIHWMARNYPQRPSLAHCMVFAGYVATPLFLSGIVALYPLVWLCALIGTIALFYTGYLHHLLYLFYWRTYLHFMILIKCKSRYQPINLLIVCFRKS